MSAAIATDMTGTLLRVWETLHAATTIERSLGLLAAVWPELSSEQWRRVSIGDRDACLFLLQESLFGADLQTIAACPSCGERLESRFTVRDICVPPLLLPQPREPLSLAHGGYSVRFRLPCSDDLLELPAATDPDTVSAALLQRCVIEAQCNVTTIEPQQLPIKVQRRVTEAMAEQDPLADLQMAVNCPACGHFWSATMDIAAYLWGELDDWAQDLLAEVHLLARHYAWSERDILSLSPVRRRFYLDLVQA
jgi:uncharacterized protein (UPF0212 family)